MIITTIERPDGQIITRTGEVGMTLTGQIDDDGVGLQTWFEVGADIPSDALAALLGTLLTFLEQKFGEQFVTGIFAHYADETGKPYEKRGGRKMYIIRGRSGGKR